MNRGENSKQIKTGFRENTYLTHLHVWNKTLYGINFIYSQNKWFQVWWPRCQIYNIGTIIHPFFCQNRRYLQFYTYIDCINTLNIHEVDKSPIPNHGNLKIWVGISADFYRSREKTFFLHLECPTTSFWMMVTMSFATIK